MRVIGRNCRKPESGTRRYEDLKYKVRALQSPHEKDDPACLVYSPPCQPRMSVCGPTRELDGPFAVTKWLALPGVMVATCVVGLAVQRETVWDGVYSPAQAARGTIAYASTCARCHGAALEGDEAPSLVGDTFMRSWGEISVAKLFAKIEAMPPKAQAHRSASANADLVAFILDANHFPAGAADLAPEAGSLEKIVIVEKAGQEIPNFSLVRVVGCLTDAADHTWILTRASEPVRTRNPGSSTETELAGSRATALASHTFKLLSLYPSPDAHKGHRMEVKGFLIRAPNDERLNVSSMAVLGTACGQ